MERILLIEDDEGAQLLFKNRLKELGYEVVTASTGARGLLEARAARFDLFLVDIGLGSGIDGYGVCTRLKGIPQNTGIPVVLISGQVKSQEELHRGYEAGCESFLVKGDLTLIEDVVRAMLRIKSLQNELALQNRLLEEQNRHLQEERKRGADLEVALRETGSRALVFRDLAAGRPDGILVVDVEGVVRMTDRGAQDILGKDIEGKHLANLAPGTGLEAFVRNARMDPHEAFRFDLEWLNGSVRSLSASVMPTVPRARGGEGSFKVLLLVDAGKRRLAGEMLRLEDKGIPRREMGPLLEAARVAFQPSALLGDSQPMRELRSLVGRAIGETGSALIRGEGGTGKELIARMLHFGGEASGPFVPVNCSALAPQLLESELFGHTKGAFPEAVADRPGLLQQAQDGTIFLDEVAELPMPLQERLLEALVKQRVRRMGSKQYETVDTRILAASSANLERLCELGRFHPELLHRLRELDIQTPPLRMRPGDIVQLARHFAQRFGGSRGLEISSEAEWVLGEYGWPGNVGELEICIECACAESAGPEIMVTDLTTPLFERFKQLSESDAIPGPVLGANGGNSAAHVRARRSPLAEEYARIEVIAEAPSLEAYEKKAILHALKETDGDKLAAAKLLHIGKSTFYRKLKAHGLS